MSTKRFVIAERVVALLLAASMVIGCNGPDADSTRGAAEAERGAGMASGTGAEAASGAARGVETEAQPETAGASAGAEPAAARTILFIGTSLTAGLGVAEPQSFPGLIERRLEDEGLPFRVVNAGVSGETSAGALRRIDWLLRQPLDVVVLETGANDMLRGVDPAVTEANIQAIIDRIRAGRPDVPIVLAGMLALPNLGEPYGGTFEAIYPRLAERNDVELIAFLLDGVGGVRELNQSDGIHPNPEGHRVIADTVWLALAPVLETLEREGAAAAP